MKKFCVFLFIFFFISIVAIQDVYAVDNDGDTYHAEVDDCDDTDNTINPAATEYCDTVDNDCDGNVDESDAADASTWYYDSDGDGFGDSETSQNACNQPANYVSDNTDCDDTDDEVNPDAAEFCDYVDNDCDGTTDEDSSIDALGYFEDSDGDGYGDIMSVAYACSEPSGYASNYQDCNDFSSSIYPGSTAETCGNSIDEDCSCAFHSWKTVSAGYDFSLVIDEDDRLWSWGRDLEGQLGIGGSNSSYEESITLVSASGTWKAVAAGSDHSVGIKSDGTLWAWGCNELNLLGLGSTDENDRLIPVQVGTDSDWNQVAAGHHFTLALKTDGSLYLWGVENLIESESRGQPPSQVGTSTDWIEISAGYTSAYAINSSGELYAWGANGFGQLGIGNTTNTTTPTQEISSSTDWVSVSGGYFHALAINSSGELYAWGRNNRDQLGIPSVQYYTDEPEKVNNDTDWEVVSASQYHSIAIKTNGELYYWGDLTPGYGVSAEDVPMQVGPSTNWTFADSGVGHTLLLTEDGTNKYSTHSFGLNSFAALGDGTTNVREYNDIYHVLLDGGTTLATCADDGDLDCNDVDNDGDGYTENEGDCDDTDNTVHPGASEVCGDSIDNNCNGNIDEETASPKITWYQDSDGDSFGDFATSTTTCAQPTGYVDNSTDCNDSNSAINPNATEVCDSVDNDCDSNIDEGVTTTYYQDSDSDTYGNPSVSTAACSQPGGYVVNNTDCNDSYSTDYPGANEVCDGRDNDCDSSTDEDFNNIFGQAVFGTAIFGGCTP